MKIFVGLNFRNLIEIIFNLIKRYILRVCCVNFCLLNVCLINNKIIIIKDFVVENNIDFFGVMEIWF